jgi:hypothetical protein
MSFCRGPSAVTNIPLLAQKIGLIIRTPISLTSLNLDRWDTIPVAWEFWLSRHSFHVAFLAIRGHNGPLVNCFSTFSNELSLKVPKLLARVTLGFSLLKPYYFSSPVWPL